MSTSHVADAGIAFGDVPPVRRVSAIVS